MKLQKPELMTVVAVIVTLAFWTGISFDNCSRHGETADIRLRSRAHYLSVMTA